MKFRFFLAVLSLWGGMPLFSLEMEVRNLVSLPQEQKITLSGVGLVTGLDGKGDRSDNRMMQALMQRLLKTRDLTLEIGDIKSRNAAVVSLLVQLPLQARAGDRLDVWVAGAGEATSLNGGILLPAIVEDEAQQIRVQVAGAIPLEVSSGFSPSRQDGRYMIARGGVVLENTAGEAQTAEASSFRLRLNRPDFSVAHRIAEEIGKAFSADTARARNAGTVLLTPPEDQDPVAFMARVMNLKITLPPSNRVVIHEKDGLLVMGQNVKIASTILSLRDAGISLQTEKKDWWVLPEDDNTEQIVIPESTTLEELVKFLQELSLSTDDLIKVIKLLKEAGSLQAELILL